MNTGNAPYAHGTVSPADERTMAILAHLSAIIAMILSVGWLSIVGPLLVWLVYRDKSAYVRHAAASSFNFNLWAWVMFVVGWLLFFTVVGIPVAIILWVVAGVMMLWCHIHAAIRANRHQAYRYPFSIPVLT